MPASAFELKIFRKSIQVQSGGEWMAKKKGEQIEFQFRWENR
jgi:hypothetical protein